MKRFGKPKRIPRGTTAQRLELAIGMMGDGFEIMRESLKRRFPKDSERKIEARLVEWIASRPLDAEGKLVPWPRPAR